MKHLRLVRTEPDAYGTFGVLYAHELKPLVTCEPPWIAWSDDGQTQHPYGQPFHSCVPTGRYTLKWVHSPRHDWAWHLAGEGVSVRDQRIVGGRYACLFHAANWPTQLQGCISVGTRMGKISNRHGIGSSKYAIGKLHEFLDHGTDHVLTITTS